MIQLQTARLIIRDHRLEDLGAYHKLLSNPTVMFRHNGISRSLEHSGERLQDSIDQIHCEPRERYFFCMEDRSSGDFIGEIGYSITTFTPKGNCAGVGYFIDDLYWGKGYTTEALKEVLRFGFEENNVIRFEAGCLKENVPSERVLLKCGFQREAELKAYQWHDGRFKDRLLFRLLRSEWPCGQ